MFESDLSALERRPGWSAGEVILRQSDAGTNWIAREDCISRLLPGSSLVQDRQRLLNEMSAYSREILAQARILGPVAVAAADASKAESWLLHPVFVCGHHRSGTTLLQQLLDGHSQLLVLPSEATYLSFFRDAARRDPASRSVDAFLSEWICRFIDPNQAPHFKLGRSDAAYNPYLAFARRALGWVDALRHHHRFACLLALAAAYRDVAAPRLSPRAWVEKTPLNEHRLPELSSFGSARFIHMVRHPAASFASLKERYRTAGIDFDPARHLRSIGRSLEAACRNRERHSRYLVVRYEDLTRVPAREIERVCRFLGLAAEEGLLIPSVAGRAIGSNSSYAVGLPGKIHEPRSVSPTPAEARRIGLFAGRPARELGYDIEVPDLLRRCGARLQQLPSRSIQWLRARLLRGPR